MDKAQKSALKDFKKFFKKGVLLNKPSRLDIENYIKILAELKKIFEEDKKRDYRSLIGYDQYICNIIDYNISIVGTSSLISFIEFSIKEAVENHPLQDILDGDNEPDSSGIGSLVYLYTPEEEQEDEWGDGIASDPFPELRMAMIIFMLNFFEKLQEKLNVEELS